ncbi:MAG: hypothetical protein H7Y11_01985, partial [Armatimonadetes bacterium]|nr:hypothetical protein [Anaerolineae bacterium]
GCAGLRLFEDTQTEDASLYESVGDAVDLDGLLTAQPPQPTTTSAPDPTATATP